jgi:hypothetical protein
MGPSGSMTRLLSWMLMNQFSFKHSSRNFPLKLSINELSVGLPGRIYSTSIPLLRAHELKSREINSGPLSTRIRSGYPLMYATSSRNLVTRLAGSDEDTAIPGQNRVKSSMIVSTRNLRPPAKESDTKSMDHTSFTRMALSIGTRARAGNFLLTFFLKR